MLLRKPPTWLPVLARAKAGSRAEVTWPDARVDALIDAYVEWREECVTVDRAYARWTGSDRAERALAHAAYRAALDREEKTAAVYELAATRLLDWARAQRQSSTGRQQCR